MRTENLKKNRRKAHKNCCDILKTKQKDDLLLELKNVYYLLLEYQIVHEISFSTVYKSLFEAANISNREAYLRLRYV